MEEYKFAPGYYQLYTIHFELQSFAVACMCNPTGQSKKLTP